MIITREEFKKKFIPWVDKKCDALPEEAFESSMIKQACKIIGDHNKGYPVGEF